MNCTLCKYENPGDAVFCGGCGKAIAIVPTLPQPPVQPAGASGPVSNELKYGIVIGSLVIPILGIIMGIQYIKDSNPLKKSVGQLWLYSGIGISVFYCMLTLGNSN